MITLKGKIVIALAVVAAIGIGCYRWWDKIAPAPKQDVQATAAQLKEKMADAGKKVASTADVVGKLLAGTNAVKFSDSAAIPAVQGVSAYKLEKKNGKPVVKFTINIWPGWAGIIVANNGMAANDESLFLKKYGFYVELSIVDDPIKARELFASGNTQILWGTLDMIAMFAPELCKDSRTIPVVPMQIDFSNGGDGCVARNGIKSINDFRMVDGKKKKVVMAQNSPSEFFFKLNLTMAGINFSDIDFVWMADAPSAAKLFVQDAKYDAFVGWSPDIYTVSDMVPGTRIVVSSATANHVIADVFAVRNDFYHDHPEMVNGLVDCILEGVEMVRKDPTNAVKIVAAAYSLPAEDVFKMIGTDGGINTGDAHLCNYRENANFFLSDDCPYNFENIWGKACVIYGSQGIAASTVKGITPLKRLADKWIASVDLSQKEYDPRAIKNLEGGGDQVMDSAVNFKFLPNTPSLEDDAKHKIVIYTNKTDALNALIEMRFPNDQENISYATDIASNNMASVMKVKDIASAFGSSFIYVEGNTDGSMIVQHPDFKQHLRDLSYRRAENVKALLLKTYPMFNPKQFITKGNGYEKPLPGLTDFNNKDHCRKNRRTDIKVVPLESQ